MSYTIDENTGEIAFAGFDQGISPSPYKGIANMQNVNIATEQGEVMCSYNRVQQSQVAGSGTLTQTSLSTVSFAGVTVLPGSWIKILVDSGTGLSGNYYYAGSGQLATKYINNNTFTSYNVSALVIGGGGAGGNSGEGSGGGAGQVLTNTALPISVGAYSITVGTGGTVTVGVGNNGGSSIFSTITAIGGYGGTVNEQNGNPYGNSGSGKLGGNGNINGGQRAGGGGAGDSGNGGNGSSGNGGSAGTGTSNSISGSAVVYATGGSGGGTNSGQGTSGTTPGSGGGGGDASTAAPGLPGVNGTIVISYPTGALYATGGTITTSGGNTIHTFTTSGTWTVSAFAPFVGNIGSGTATFSVYSMGSPVQSASEIYTSASNGTQYRYYILDNLGQVWIQDTNNGIQWFMSEVVSQTFTTASGLAILNGWLTVTFDNNTYWKNTTTLDNSFVGGVQLATKLFHSTLVGHQGKLYWTDGNFIASMFPNSSLISGIANIQTTASYTTSTVTGTISTLIDGTLPTSGIVGGTRIPVYLFTDSTGTLPSAISSGTLYYLSITTLTYPITFNIYDVASSQNYPLTSTLSIGATSASLTSPFGGVSGNYTSSFSSGDVRVVTYTNGATGITWTGALTGSTTANILLGATINLQTGAQGAQYFTTFSPYGQGYNTYTYSPQRLNLPYFETATCMVELGNSVIVGGTGNVLYPWDQVQALPASLIYLPENNTAIMITVESNAYVFSGNKGNIYVTNGSSASFAITVPDYCAGIPGTPSTYFEPYFTWGGAMFLRGRVYFSILDQTSTKTGNCGGIWSFTPTQNFFIGQDTGLALRLENQSSYGTYNGACPVLLPVWQQNVVSPQYFSAWYSSISTPTYGIDATGTTTGIISIIETDLVSTAGMLDKKTFKQIKYKVSSPLQTGETVTVKYRQNSTDAYSTTNSLVSDNSLSGYFPINFDLGQYVQLQATLTPLSTSSSSFVRLNELKII